MSINETKSSPAESPHPSSAPHLKVLDTLFTSRADKHIAHLTRLLSTASGIDSALTLACYGLTLAHSQLNHLLSVNLRFFALRIARNASKTLRPGETVIATLPAPAATARIAALHSATKTLAGMCSDVRAFTRLWMMLSMWAWARNTYFNGPKDKLLKAVTWGQVFVNVMYLILEHPAYLAGKGVLKSISAKQQGKLWNWSCRFFTLHVVLDFVRLWRLRELRTVERMERGSDNGEKDVKIEREKEDALWRKDFGIDLAYSPLVLHWSTPGGLVSDTWVGLLGTWVGVLKVRDAWRRTA